MIPFQSAPIQNAEIEAGNRPPLPSTFRRIQSSEHVMAARIGDRVGAQQMVSQSRPAGWVSWIVYARSSNAGQPGSASSLGEKVAYW